jgi:hypothetical protein
MRRFFVCALLLVSLGLVVAQGVAQPITPPDVAPIAAAVEPEGDIFATIENLLTVWLPRLVMLCTGLTVIFPSTNKAMGVIDAFAGAWGKARNDPAVQRWGKVPA